MTIEKQNQNWDDCTYVSDDFKSIQSPSEQMTVKSELGLKEVNLTASEGVHSQVGKEESLAHKERSNVLKKSPSRNKKLMYVGNPDTSNNSTLEDNFLKKEIEEVEKEIDKIYKEIKKIAKEEKVSPIPTFQEANELRILDERLKTLKECKEKHKKFVEKLKLYFYRDMKKEEMHRILDKLSSEEELE